MKAQIFSVTAKAIVAMDLFRPGDKDMGAISGINIRPDGRGGSLLAALNGHQAALLHEPFSECQEEVTITPSKAFIKALKEVVNEPFSLVRYDGERLSLTMGENTLMDQHDSCAVKDLSDYPKLTFVAQAEGRRRQGYKPSSLTIPYDGLKPFQAVAKLYGADKVDRAVSMYPSGPEAPCLVRMDCNVNFLGVIMPMMLTPGAEGDFPERTQALAGFEGLDAA